MSTGTNPLQSKIALTVAHSLIHTKPPILDDPACRGRHAPFVEAAAAVIDALGLDFTSHPMHTPDGRHVETLHRVAGGWSVAGGDW